jgi:nuclear pore complex protein Nup188
LQHSKVVLSEPASTGTLLELCNCALDVLRRLSAQPAAGQAITVAGPRGEKPLDVEESVVAARRTLETAALFAVTQLALWAAKPDADEPLTNDMDADEMDAAERSFTASSSPERRLTLSSSRITSAPEPRKSSVSANERLRMGMTNEIAADLLSLLNKARPVLQKLDEGAKDGKSVDLFRVLAFFLQEHVATS